MTTSPQPASPKPEPVNIVLRLILLIMVTVPTAICWIFFFGKLYGVILLAGYAAFVTVIIWLSKRRKTTEADSLRRIDKAMGTPSKDPRQMARFMH